MLQIDIADTKQPLAAAVVASNLEPSDCLQEQQFVAANAGLFCGFCHCGKTASHFAKLQK